ncbi:hypothetical protein HYALB_00005934 [Hymenoscyphus albidus]|uniref:Pali-domain-containing protein n=1 Tax=Hymenoscyphus albidus TaxID=595503 RepID=A0A9N9Q8D1_9HELO|nr:hypothetical protein HYALB_00005934 [Hymenoscyphus albidus]
MLRPATPLTILLLISFLLLLVSVLSTPIIKQISLASFEGVDFGVFGLCKGTDCSHIEIGYSTDGLFTDSQTATFDLPSSTRTTLSAILIVHPIAALFTLVMLVLAGSAHFHAPSHSPRYLLGIFILSILTLILALLSFLIDVLLFVPHMAWGSYIVLAATVLIACSGIVSCAMRRTLVSRKARKRRIAENAEMNGANFYNREGRPNPAFPAATDASKVSGAPGTDKLPEFATFEMSKQDTNRTSDERIPLTTKSPTTGTSPSNLPGTAYRGPPSRGNGSPPRPPRELDQYGNPLPLMQPGAFGAFGASPNPPLQHQASDPSMRGRGMPPGGFRGRGGYPPGRGGYGPPRGGYGGPPRGGYMGNQGYGQPRGGGFSGPPRGRGGGPPPGYGVPQNRGYDNRGQSPGGYRGPSPALTPGYNQNAYAVPPLPSTSTYAAYNPDTDDSRSSLPRAESPPPLPGSSEGPVGQAIEMDATTGSPSHPPKGHGQFPLKDDDGDVAGMVGLQQQKMQRETLQSGPSRYSTEDYVPPRSAWGAGQVDAGRSSPASRPVEPARQNTPPRRRESSDNYYEDVAPRFAEPPVPSGPGIAQDHPNNNPSGNLRVQPPGLGMDGSYSYEDVASGARSPAESEHSTFTSISQRGINPRWNPGPSYGGPMPNRGPPPQQQREDLLLNSNPDFMLPGSRGGGARGRGRGGRGGQGRPPGQIPGMVPKSAYPGN